MVDPVFNIVTPVLNKLVETENEDRMDVDRGDDERTEKEL